MKKSAQHSLTPIKGNLSRKKLNFKMWSQLLIALQKNTRQIGNFVVY